MKQIMDAEILNGISEGLQILDSEWKYTWLNDAAIQQSRYTRQELLGNRMTDLYPGIENSAMFHALQQFRNTQTAGIFENHFIYPNGMSAWFELHIRPAKGFLIILSIDITARKEAELSRERYKKGLETMIEYISMNFRPPVTRIQNAIGHLIKEPLKGADLGRITELLTDSVTQLDGYTRELTNNMVQLKAETNR